MLIMSNTPKRLEFQTYISSSKKSEKFVNFIKKKKKIHTISKDTTCVLTGAEIT